MALYASAQHHVRPPVNSYFGGKVNPFQEVLGLSPYTTSLSRDSVRIHLDGGGSIALVLDRKRPWRFHQYDRSGTPMDAGDFHNGTGRIRFIDGDRMCEAEFKDGTLNGTVVKCRRVNGKWVAMLHCSFQDGLLQGEARWQSMWDPSQTASISMFDRGVIQMRETYGRLNWLHGLLPFLPMFLDEGKVCSRVVFVDGYPSTQECLLTRKCKYCGM